MFDYNNEDHKVVGRLENTGLRSKLEIIIYNEKFCIKKTFRDNALRFMKNEIEARACLEHHHISEILETGHNYIVIPYYKNRLSWDKNSPWLYPVDEAREIMEFVHWLNNAGYAMLDWHPNCAIFDIENGLKFIDFEFFTKTSSIFKDFDKSIDFLDKKTGDPFLDEFKITSYQKSWLPILGVSFYGLMNYSKSVLICKRFFYYIFHFLPVFIFRRVQLFARKFIRKYFWRKKYKFNEYFLIID